MGILGTGATNSMDHWQSVPKTIIFVVIGLRITENNKLIEFQCMLVMTMMIALCRGGMVLQFPFLLNEAKNMKILIDTCFRCL